MVVEREKTIDDLIEATLKLVPEQRLKLVKREIDKSLDMRNKELFMELTEEYKNLLNNWR